jgi:hypothetical protein
MSETTPTIEQSPAAQAPSLSMLASRYFGSEYKGEVKQPEPAAPAQEAATTEEVVTDPVQEPEVPAVTEAPTTEEVPISSISQLAEKFELDPDWLETVEVDVKINGQEGKAKLADLKKSYQITQAAEQRLAEAKELKRIETQALAQKRDLLNAEYGKVASLIENAEKLFTQEYQHTDWNKLRTDDPAEFSARKAEYDERKKAIDQLKAGALQQYQASMAANKQEMESQRQAYLAEEAQKLREALPEWKDEAVQKAESQEIAQYLASHGFTKEEIASASDHRSILMARKAMLYDKGQNKTELAKKKVLTIPKVMKPGTTKPPEQAKHAQIEAARAKLRQTGKLEDALALKRLQGK